MNKNIFDQANAFTAKWEGGFVNHPKDPGGATNYGVSLRWLKAEGIDVTGDGVIDINDIRALTVSKAAGLFHRGFWQPLHLNAFPPLTATATYDAAVNTGRGQAAKFLQRACNTFPGGEISVDGAIGPRTRARVLALEEQDFVLAIKCIEFREAFHNQLANNSPYPDGRDYRDFLRGWLNRTADLRGFVKNWDAERKRPGPEPSPKPPALARCETCGRELWVA